MTEQEMREMKVEYPRSREELNTFLDKLESEELDYGKCVYVMSMAAMAAFNYAANRVGASGFQASCAELDFLRRSRGIERFMIVNIDDAMYPQYDIEGKVRNYIAENKEYLTEKAKENLADRGEHVHPDVHAHWEKLANG